MLIIDCSIETPAKVCVQRLENILGISTSYILAKEHDFNTLPEEHFSAIFVLGSFSNVCDKLPWHQGIIDFVTPHLKNGIPTLGICFGHQLFADYFGAKVIKRNELWEGIRPVNISSDFINDLKNKSYYGIFSHKYEVTNLPSELIQLAGSKYCTNEVITHRDYPYLGFQAHPEASKYFIQNTFCEMPDQNALSLALKDGPKFILDFINSFHKTEV